MLKHTGRDIKDKASSIKHLHSAPANLNPQKVHRLKFDPTVHDPRTAEGPLLDLYSH